MHVHISQDGKSVSSIESFVGKIEFDKSMECSLMVTSKYEWPSSTTCDNGGAAIWLTT